MIRGSTGTGPFNTNWNIKLIYLVFAIFLCLYEYKKNHKRYFVGLLTTGTIMWTCAEIFLQLSGTRDFSPAILFGLTLPIWIQLPFQGLVEGAFVAIICMFFSDRVLEKKKRIWSIIGFTGLMCLMVMDAFKSGIQLPDYGAEVPSRREMFGPVSLTFLIILCVIDIVFFITAKDEYKKKGIYLTIFMIIFASIWTIAEYLAGTRWIEIGNEGTYTHAPALIEFGALAFDIIIEVALAYVPFLAIPYFLHYRKKTK